MRLCVHTRTKGGGSKKDLMSVREGGAKNGNYIFPFSLDSLPPRSKSSIFSCAV
jgi:hypothetical protein